MKTTYTPGPWTVSYSFDANVRREIWTETDPATGNRELVALIPDAEGDHINADAWLIAAAPELLAALSWALDQIEDDLDFDHQAALQAARSALGKAMGGVR